jgi:outer membrane biogenesis lipoprotein LolB
MSTTLHHPAWRRLALALLASASLLLGGCAAMRAQNPDSSWRRCAPVPSATTAM